MIDLDEERTPFPDVTSQFSPTLARLDGRSLSRHWATDFAFHLCSEVRFDYRETSAQRQLEFGVSILENRPSGNSLLVRLPNGGIPVVGFPLIRKVGGPGTDTLT